MQETLLYKIATQIPDLVAIVIVIMIFLRAQERQMNTIRELHEEHIESRKESRIVLTRCTEVLGEAVEAMHAFSIVAQNCSRLMK